jgi:hypothetical protein
MGDTSAELAAPAKRRSSGRKAKRVTLTALERQVYELRTTKKPPPSWAECARQLGKDERWLRRSYNRALGKVGREGQLDIQRGSLADREPEKYAQAVDLLTNADAEAQMSAAAIAKRLNLPKDTAQAVAREIRSIYFPTAIEARSVKLDRLKELWGMRAEEALAAITPAKMASSSAKDNAIIAGIATEKLLLLRGQPTQIVRTEKERAKLDVLAQAFMSEARRRGYRVDTDEATGQIDLTYDPAERSREEPKNVTSQEADGSGA